MHHCPSYISQYQFTTWRVLKNPKNEIRSIIDVKIYVNHLKVFNKACVVLGFVTFIKLFNAGAGKFLTFKAEFGFRWFEVITSRDRTFFNGQSLIFRNHSATGTMENQCKTSQNLFLWRLQTCYGQVLM